MSLCPFTVCVYAVLYNYKVEMMKLVIQMALQATMTHSQKMVVRVFVVEVQSMFFRRAWNYGQSDEWNTMEVCTKFKLPHQQ